MTELAELTPHTLTTGDTMHTDTPPAAPAAPAAPALFYTGTEHTYRVTATRRHAGIRPRPGVTRAVQVEAVTECRCPLAGTGGHGIPVGAIITVPVASLTEGAR